MVGKKQRNRFFEYEGLTKAEVSILKALATWPFSTRLANFFNISQAVSLNDSYVSRCLRRLHNRGIVFKSLGGSWHVNEVIHKQIINELEKQSSQNELSGVKESTKGSNENK